MTFHGQRSSAVTIKLRVLRWADYLDGLGKPSVITVGSISPKGRQEGQNERSSYEHRSRSQGFVVKSQGIWPVSRTGKSKVTESSLELPEGTQPC